MRKMFFLIFLIISCPKPGLQKATCIDYLKEAERVYKENPLYAYNILNDSTICTTYPLRRAEILVKLYLNQREYQRAAALLDSIHWQIPLSPQEKEFILLKTRRWEMLIHNTNDTLLLGIAYNHLDKSEEAIKLLSSPQKPHDYRIINLARVYIKKDDLKNAFNTLLSIDSLSDYLYQDYQKLLFTIFLNYEDFKTVQKELTKIKKPDLRAYILLKIYEKKEDKKNLKKTAWKLIKKYPGSEGAYYALRYVKPTTKAEHKAVGKVYFYHKDYNKAVIHFKSSKKDNAVNYYLGRIYYNKKNYSLSLKYLARSNWAAAYYYRGRIYEKLKKFNRAIMVYDSLYTAHNKSKYATRGFKRKAFLLEDIGDTLKAVETFLKIDEKNTRFRAAMQLFRLGALDKADSILRISDDPAFIYWRIRILERLGKPTDELQEDLSRKYPLSYYTVVRINKGVVFDTMTLEDWIKTFDDTIVSFSRDDSLHLLKAQKYFRLNETEYAGKELDLIREKSAQDILYLSKLCSKHGADKQSILYALKIKKMAKQNNLNKFPVELFELMYPIKYTFTILEQKIDLSLCLAMIWQESLFDPEARSWADARGIMQIIPPTAKKIARELNIQNYSLYEPSLSIKFGCYYFLNLLNEFKSVPLSLAGYNAGPVRVKRWIEQDPNYELDEFIDLIPYNETRNYVKSILSRRVIYQQLIGV